MTQVFNGLNKKDIKEYINLNKDKHKLKSWNKKMETTNLNKNLYIS